MRIRLCPIFVCQYHPYDQCDVQANKEFMENLRGWTKITDNLYIWHYSSVYCHLLTPMPDLIQVPQSLRTYRRMGIKGVMVEGSHIEATPEFMGELKAYLIAKLMWDVERNLDEVIDEFLRGYYGEAGRPVRKFLDLLHAQIGNRNLHGSCWPEADYVRHTGGPQPAWPYVFVPLLSSSVMAEGDRLLAEAERLASTPEQLSRIKRIVLALDYVRIMRRLQTANALGDDVKRQSALKEMDTFRQRCEALGIEGMDICMPMTDSIKAIAERYGKETK